MNAELHTAAQVRAFCRDIGADPLLVQGAGGNVSWKDGDVLWIKASGTWLADADRRDIFVPVNLVHMQTAIRSGQYDVEPRLRHDFPTPALRPSIETMLHALMPQPVVAHVHAVDVLAYLVCEDLEARLRPRLPTSLNCVEVGYHKPGAALAQAVHHAMSSAGSSNVVLMKNHGVVIGGPDVATVHQQLKALVEACRNAPNQVSSRTVFGPETLVCDGTTYQRLSSPRINLLALDPDLFNRLSGDWALYPDHVVFLGPQAVCFNSAAEAEHRLSGVEHLPKLVFVQGSGVFILGDESPALLAQLQCYLDVLLRLQDDVQVCQLSGQDVATLVNWEAEAYRQRQVRT